MSALNPDHPMSEMAQQNMGKFLLLTIWKLRKHCPDLAVELGSDDMKSFSKAFAQGTQKPTLAVIGKRDSIVLQLVDEATGKKLLIEQGDPNSPNARAQRASDAARKNAQSLVDQLSAMTTTRVRSRRLVDADKRLIAEAIVMIKALTWEPSE